MEDKKERLTFEETELSIVKSIHQLTGEYLEAFKKLKEDENKGSRHYELYERMDTILKEVDEEQTKRNKDMVLDGIKEIIHDVELDQARLDEARSKLIQEGLLEKIDFQKAEERPAYIEGKKTHEQAEELYNKYLYLKKELKKIFKLEEK